MIPNRLAAPLASLFLALASAASAQPARGPEWTAADCSAFDLRLADRAAAECGFLSVRERRDQGASRRIDLAVAILAPVQTPLAAEPLFLAQGGPGAGTIGSFGQALLDDPGTRPAGDRALVLWDQRGTGFSRPALTCPELIDAERAQAAGQTPAEEEAATLAATRACGARLKAAGADLAGYNSVENAEDVETLRRALGYGKIAFYGVSYGTELAQFVMRRHPDALSAVVLDAVVPLDYNLFTEPAFAEQRIGEKYLLGCAREQRCDAAFPDLSARYLALIDRLNATPAEVRVSVPPAGDGQPAAPPASVALTGDMLEEAIYGALYSDLHDLVPLIIDRADKGDFTLVTTLLLPMTVFDQSFAEGMHLAVSCSEHGDIDAAALDFPGVLPRLAEQTRSGAALAARVCRAWGIPLLPRQDLAPVASGLPVLMLSGDFDPITPPSYAEKLLPTLSNARHVIFPAGAHGQAMSDPCANALIADFLDDPEAPLDTTCVAAQPGKFVTAEDVIFLGTLGSLLASQGIDGFLLSGVMAIPAVLAAALLATALIVYPLGAAFARRRGPRVTRDDGAAARLSRAVPWLAGAAALVAIACLAGLVAAVGSTLVTNQNLAGMGAIPARWRFVTMLPPLLGVLALALLAAMVACWATRRRGLPGRVYLSLLSLAAVVAAANLALLTR